MGSAEIAKLRLIRADDKRISYDEWLGRVEEILAVDDYTLNDFPHTDFRAFYDAGDRAWRVALTVLGSQTAVRETTAG